MATVECGNGHVYDPDEYSSCPYCGRNTRSIDFTGGGDEMRTVAPWHAGMNPEDKDRSGDLYSGGYQDKLDVTQPPIEWGSSREPDPISPTVPVSLFEEPKPSPAVLPEPAAQTEPVVGWLVCVEGTNKGRDYRIYGKINRIGSRDENDIVISGDSTVSRNHARLAYDPLNNDFYFMPWNNSNNLYINNRPIYEAARLKAYDVIILGKSRMVFVPFCSDRFTWADGLTEGDK